MALAGRIESIASADQDLRGIVFLQQLSAGPAGRALEVTVLGRSSPTTYFTFNSPVPATVPNPDTSNQLILETNGTPHGRFVVYELEPNPAGDIVVNTGSIPDSPLPDLTPIVVSLPRPPRVPVVSGAPLTVHLPTTGTLAVQPVGDVTGQAISWWTTPSPLPPVLGTASGTVTGTQVSYMLSALDGDLAPTMWEIFLPAHTPNDPFDTVLRFPAAAPITDFTVPPVVSAAAQGTTLDDVVVTASAPGYSSSRMEVELASATINSGALWTIDRAWSPAAYTQSLPQLPSGVTLATLGITVASAGIPGAQALVRLHVNLDGPNAPPRWSRERTYVPAAPTLSVDVADVTVQPTGR